MSGVPALGTEGRRIEKHAAVQSHRFAELQLLGAFGERFDVDSSSEVQMASMVINPAATGP